MKKVVLPRLKLFLLLVMLAVLVVPLIFSSCALLYKGKVTFEQLDLDINGEVTEDSSTGMATLTYNPFTELIYFNLAVNGEWVIKNVLVPGKNMTAANEPFSFSFDLGVDDGTDVTSLEYAFSLTPDTIDTMPSPAVTATVSDGSYIIDNGLPAPSEEISENELDDPMGAPLKPGSITLVDYAGQDMNYPVNQECGKKECAPAGLSNSLRYLNSKHDLGLGGEGKEITIAKMKEIIGWEGGNCPADYAEKKKAFMDGNANYPITTEIIYPKGDGSKFDRVLNDLKTGQDVELWVLNGINHLVMLKFVYKYKDEEGKVKYGVYVTHDTQQGEEGGTKTEFYKYDPEEDKFRGKGKLNGTKIKQIVVECPAIATTTTVIITPTTTVEPTSTTTTTQDLLYGVPIMTGTPTFDPDTVEAGGTTIVSVPVSTDAETVGIRLHDPANPPDIAVIIAYGDNPEGADMVHIETPWINSEPAQLYLNVYVWGSSDEIFSFYSRVTENSETLYTVHQEDGLGGIYDALTDIPIAWMAVIE